MKGMNSESLSWSHQYKTEPINLLRKFKWIIKTLLSFWIFLETAAVFKEQSLKHYNLNWNSLRRDM